MRVPGGPAENTLAAFDAALAAGCDGFEFDVRLSSDGVPVIIHDPQRMGKEVARSPATSLNLPSLEDVLARYSGAALLNIELKVPGIEPATARLVARYCKSTMVVISSFLPEVLFALQAANPELPLGYIFDEAKSVDRWRELPISHVIPHHSLVHQNLLDEVHSKGRKLLTWTVNRTDDMLRFAQWGVDGIISDDPQLLVTALK